MLIAFFWESTEGESGELSPPPVASRDAARPLPRFRRSTAAGDGRRRGMSHDDLLGARMNEHRGHRQHRFMESADINVVFRELFRPLQANVRRGMTIEGQLYGIEMDPCIPGELLGSTWIAPTPGGVADPDLMAEPAHRRALFAQLLAEPRPEAVFVYVCERQVKRKAVLHVELASEDGHYVAEYPIRSARGWHHRELVEAPHQRLGPLAVA
ncbi:MAG: hypothetical protein MZW92_34885 [Comamonadaceae bacterium]|nr:hypothetical protein [Comamonadaceae bacterium]